jgi:hypothetical protein
MEQAMTHSPDNPFDPSSLFTSWMSSVTDLWSNMSQPIPPAPETPGYQQDTQKNPDQGSDFFKTSMDAFQSIASAMGGVDTASSAVPGAGALPEILLKMTQPVFSSMTQMIQQIQHQMGEAGDHLKTFNFSNLDTETFHIWEKLYDKEFRKLLKVPQLGLTREYQEKAALFWDRLNILESAMAEFLHFLYLPFEKSHTSFIEKLAELAKKDDLPKDAKSYYQIWLKILEGHYMTLFQDPEYIASLSKTLSAVAAYEQTKKSLTNDLLHQLSIPSSKDIDGVYRELYDLKKRIKNLEKAITNR